MEAAEPAAATAEKVIDLTAGEEGAAEKVTTLREVLEDLCIPPSPHSPPEEGEITESSDGMETGESCVIDLTCEEVSDSDSEVVCMEDLTVIDEEEVTIIQGENEVVTTVETQMIKSKKKTKKRRSIRSSICEGIGRKPSNDDALSKSTKEITGVTPRYWERFTAAPQPSSSNAEIRICSYNVLLGYAAFYKQRTRGLNDGCAVLVRKSKFDVISYRIVEYFVGAGTTMDRDQIGQILRLRCKKTGQDIIYANTHLLFNSSRGDIKIGQLAMLFANIQDVLKSSPCPVILNGDFNIEPLSYVYTYISESSVFLRGLPRNELSGQGERGGPYVQANKILPTAANVGRDSMFIDPKAPREVAADYFTHPLRLASVYHHFNSDGKKEVSTYHKEVANPDFIFYSIKDKNITDSISMQNHENLCYGVFCW
ncbi:hypothetical protein OESDEN_07970 [Oesophagostomum dentatum]|uniref:Endonuclease/exonuclease/phosphatase domain-containing protein n=1 Tax=Oesophagostomum dentatum TaxID=61180 RepID=A0A0B1T4M5_OESDE|nr:hypothetical protein OESDEN_07970 [Oesophagostomum dentatum]